MKKLKLNIQKFSSTNKTTNYELPQFIGTDKPTWLGDINQAMLDIDTGMHENATDIATMQSDVESASAAASQASQDVSTLTSTVNTLSTNVTAVTTTANNAQSTATSALNTANTANGKADTNASNIGNLSNLITDDKTSIVNAINEIDTKELGITGNILWTNPNPRNSFSSQTINLSESLNNYDAFEIIYRNSTSNVKDFNTGIIPVGHGTTMSALGGGVYFYRNTNDAISGSTITFDKGEMVSAQTGAVTDDNSRIIPIYVIGYNTGLFN